MAKLMPGSNTKLFRVKGRKVKRTSVGLAARAPSYWVKLYRSRTRSALGTDPAALVTATSKLVRQSERRTPRKPVQTVGDPSNAQDGVTGRQNHGAVPAGVGTA